MQLDLVSRAESRIAEIDQQQQCLEYEKYELQTAIRVLHRFLDEANEPQLSEAAAQVERVSRPSASSPVESEPTEISTPIPEPDRQPDLEARIEDVSCCGVDDVMKSPAGADCAENQPPIQPEADTENRSEYSDPIPEAQPLHIPDQQVGAENEVEPHLRGSTAADADAREIAGRKSLFSKVQPKPVTLTDPVDGEPSNREVLERCHAEHPDWPAKVIAEHTGLPRGTITGYAAKLGIKLPAQADYEATQRAKTVEALKPAPKPQPEPEQPPAAISEAPEPDPEPAPRPLKSLAAKLGTKFMLQDRETGNWLHESCAERKGVPLLTSDKRYAWKGHERQMLAVRTKLPATVDFNEVVAI